jgi:hypothetical protein
MITLLTSELNRINQGCDEWNIYHQCEATKKHKLKCGSPCEYCDEIVLCPKCKDKKETLKKVSLMWADKELKWLEPFIDGTILNLPKWVSDIYGKHIKQLQQIKSLMEKA